MQLFEEKKYNAMQNNQIEKCRQTLVELDNKKEKQEPDEPNSDIRTRNIYKMGFANTTAPEILLS
jgi:hypothetical protein